MDIDSNAINLTRSFTLLKEIHSTDDGDDGNVNSVTSDDTRHIYHYAEAVEVVAQQIFPVGTGGGEGKGRNTLMGTCDFLNVIAEGESRRLARFMAGQ